MRLNLNNYEWQELHPGLHVLSLLSVDFTPLAEGITTRACTQMRGHWAAIEVDDAGVRIAMDPLRSFPVFWTYQDDELWVSDDFMFLHQKFPQAMDPAARELLSFTCFTAAEATFNSGISIAQGGAVTHITDAGARRVEHYRDMALTEEKYFDEAEFIEVLGESLDHSFNSMIEANPDGNFVIPLSGGFDSRLFAVYLARTCPERVRSFTYGIPGAAEVQISQSVAKQLDVAWKAVELNSELVDSYWDRPDMADFLAYASAGSALPHLQDYFALRALIDEGYVKEGDIVLPGHTVVGNLWDTELLDADLPEIVESAWQHQGALRKSKPSREVLDLFAGDFQGIVERHGKPRTRRDRQRICELHNMISRQTRYINNSMRAYEFLGLRWALPCLDAPFADVWFAGSVELTAKREAYRRWIDAEFEKETAARATASGSDGVADAEQSSGQPAAPEYYAASGVGLPSQLVAAVKPVAKALGIDRAYWKLQSRKTNWRHPLGFELYLRDYPQWKRALRTAQGLGPLSCWMEQFLTDTWHPQLHLFTE